LLSAAILAQVVPRRGDIDENATIGEALCAALLVIGIIGLLVFALVLLAGWLEWLVERDDK